MRLFFLFIFLFYFSKSTLAQPAPALYKQYVQIEINYSTLIHKIYIKVEDKINAYQEFDDEATSFYQHIDKNNYADSIPLGKLKTWIFYTKVALGIFELKNNNPSKAIHYFQQLNPFSDFYNMRTREEDLKIIFTENQLEEIYLNEMMGFCLHTIKDKKQACYYWQKIKEFKVEKIEKLALKNCK